MKGLIEGRTSPVDGFRLAYWRGGSGKPVVLLHGWPGDHADYRELTPLLIDRADVVVPDLRGFGRSDKHPADPALAYSAAAQARSVLGLIDELNLERPVVAGYDVGSRVAQALARSAPQRLRAIVVGPPLPGVGDRVLTPEAQREFWYQPFHRLPLSVELVDGHPAAVRSYLAHFWSHWSGPAYRLPEADLTRLAAGYSEPGAFAASIAWYRAGSGTLAIALAEKPPDPGDRLAVPTSVLWPQEDPLFPPAWSDRIGQFFSRATLRNLPGAGHFIPLEAPQALAEAILGGLVVG